MLETLRTDFHRIPELLAQGAPEQPHPEEDDLPGLDELEFEAPELGDAVTSGGRPEPAPQLGLF
jgi:hypothetical protein